MKIFCIGHNKTGTSSLSKEFENNGFTIAPQREGEKLLKDYLENNFKNILNFCKNYEVFQDVPFSLKNTFIHLEKKFPDSKFILSVRDSSEQWYQSLVNYHAKMFGHHKTPKYEHLKNSNYVYSGWIWDYFSGVYDVDQEDIYNKKKLIEYYESHNSEIIEYFKEKDNFIKINLSIDSDYEKFKSFVGINNLNKSFPHVNIGRKLVYK